MCWVWITRTTSNNNLSIIKIIRYFDWKYIQCKKERKDGIINSPHPVEWRPYCADMKEIKICIRHNIWIESSIWTWSISFQNQPPMIHMYVASEFDCHCITVLFHLLSALDSMYKKRERTTFHTTKNTLNSQHSLRFLFMH